LRKLIAPLIIKDKSGALLVNPLIPIAPSEGFWLASLVDGSCAACGAYALGGPFTLIDVHLIEVNTVMINDKSNN